MIVISVANNGENKNIANTTQVTLMIVYLVYYIDDDGDDDMLMVDPDPLIILDDTREPHARGDNQLGSKLQGLLYHGLVMPIIKARWVIIGK